MIFDLIYLFCVGYGCFFSIILFFRREISVRLFSLILILLNYEIFMQFFYRKHGYYDYIILFNIRDSFFFLYGPLLYFYILSIARKITKYDHYKLFHLIPFAIVLAGGTFADIYVSSLINSSADYLFENIRFPKRALLYFCVFVSASVYIVLSLKEVLLFYRRVKIFHSYEMKFKRNWQIIFLCYAANILVLYAVSTIMYLLNSRYSGIVSFSFCVYIYVPVFFAGYAVLLKGDYFNIIHKSINEEALFSEEEDKNSNAKYARSRLPERAKEEYLARILHLLDVEKVYLDSELTMQSFSIKSGIPLYHISQVVNLRLGVNYNALINGRRIVHAKSLLSDKSDMNKTILEIAFESGFNSKTTFNNLFREETGLTPTEFRRKAENE